MTRFGEISSLWHKLKHLWQFYERLFSIWQKLLLTLVNFVYNWALFRVIKWTCYENYKSHLVTLQNYYLKSIFNEILSSRLTGKYLKF